MGTQIRFWKDPYKNTKKSEDSGTPVFDTVDWCEVRVLGESDTTTGPWHRMPDHIREEFRKAHEEWLRDNSTEGIVGTHLKMVAWLERGDVETLAHLGIRTLENLASVNDGAIGNIPGGLALRKKAQEMLKAAKEDAPLQKMSDELAKRDEQIASLKAQIAEILDAKRKKAKE